MHHPTALPEGADWRGADATDREAAADAAKGASVIYQCLNAPYTKWPEQGHEGLQTLVAFSGTVLDGRISYTEPWACAMKRPHTR
jgi:hypothetical protein